MAADLEAMKLCFVSRGSVLAAVIHAISHVRFFQVAATEEHLASDVRVAGGRSMVSVTGKEKRCSAREDPGKRLKSATVVPASLARILARFESNRLSGSGQSGWCSIIGSSVVWL
ncbi:hypothetical protein NE237_007518 [Protea cynaroides]|uniref:Uncharacterized protein n=1 Tax=Protea cynaroides TaxID=273540 RepID=A0A9Q0KPN0_9MAGN|nr:hypothetical protein NE237_007518 [Protea cynaroides]